MAASLAEAARPTRYTMMALPSRIATPARTPSASGAAVPEAGEAADSALVASALDARMTALVTRARVPTPEDEALERQSEEFDFITRVQAESDREINALRDIAMEQMKQDDALLKKWIALI